MRWDRMLVGLASGAVLGLAELFVVAVGVVAGLVGRSGSGTTARVDRLANRLVAVQLRRIRWYAGNAPDLPDPDHPATDAALRTKAMHYLAARAWVGILGGLVLLLLLLGVLTVLSTLAGWLFDFPFPLVSDAGRVSLGTILVLAVPGLVLFFLNITGIYGVAVLDRQLAARMLGADDAAEYRRRIAELASTRAGVVEAVNDERRRIERALHDGVQQRIVMLSLLIGRARRGIGSGTEPATDPDQPAELLWQAQQQTQRVLDELRETAWRIYPSALDTGGLRAALETVAERTAIPLRIEYELSARPPSSHETLAYFLISEAITNATKHADASRVEVAVTEQEESMRVRVTDDGVGGADPTGGGLSGLAGRVHALDGRFQVHSPPGGPTSIIADLPLPTPSTRASSTQARA